MARYRLDSLDDIIRQDYWVRITCERCGHAVLANPIELRSELVARRRSRQLDRLADSLKCSACSARGEGAIMVMPCQPPS